MAFSMLPRSVGKVASLSKQIMSPAFTSYGVRGHELKMDPVMNVDDFMMSQPTFPPHPHAGFSAVTYMLPDSEGSFLNTDSLGDRTVIHPGDLHWTQAGKGMMHEEIPTAPGTWCHGLQIFVNLGSTNKLIPPKAMHLAAAEVPLYTTPEGVQARVLAGDCNGVSSPLADHLATPIQLLDVVLPAGAVFEVAVPVDHNAFAMVLKGSVLVGKNRRQVDAHQACDFEQDGEAVCVEGKGPEAAQLVLFAGRPLDQPSVWQGPFNGVSRQQVQAYAQAYAAGEMGRLVSSA